MDEKIENASREMKIELWYLAHFGDHIFKSDYLSCDECADLQSGECPGHGLGSSGVDICAEAHLTCESMSFEIVDGKNRALGYFHKNREAELMHCHFLATNKDLLDAALKKAKELGLPVDSMEKHERFEAIKGFC